MGLSNAERQERWRIKRNKEIEELRKAANGAKPASQELAALRQRVRELEAALAAKPASKPAKAAQTKAAKAPLPPDEVRDRQIKALKTQVKNLMSERDAAFHLAEGVIAVGGMRPETRRAIDKVLHPDSRPTEVDRDEACKGWNVWKNSNDKARRRPGKAR
jgi:hypothetical protein